MSTNELEKDKARLDWIESQVTLSRTGVSFDKIPRVEDELGGFRFMRFHRVDSPNKTLREAIDKAMEVSK